jgi:hypothetical protein
VLAPSPELEFPEQTSALEANTQTSLLPVSTANWMLCGGVPTETLMM